MKACIVWIPMLFAPVAFSQTIIFSEDVGAPAATTVVSSYTGWQNGTPISFTSTSSPESEVRNTTASSGYLGASGGGNVFFTNVIGRNLVISGINSSGFSNITLGFGHFKNATAGSNELLVEVSADGTLYTPLDYTRASGTGTANWTYIIASGNIPASTNLRIRFTQTSASVQFRIDDVRLTADAALPIRFGYLRLSESAAKIRVAWTNLSESDLSYYTIQGAGLGLVFRNFDTVPARLNDGGRADYECFIQPIPGHDLFYRVEATENSGEKIYSAVIRREPERPGLRVYPNPSMTGQIHLQADLPRGEYSIIVMDARNVPVYQLPVSHAGGRFVTTLFLSHLSPGAYTLLVDEQAVRFLVLE